MAFDTQTLSTDPLCRPTVRSAAILARKGGGAVDIAVDIPTDFRLQSGERLGQRKIVGRLHGRAGAPLVVVAGGISAGRFVHRTETNGLGWWSGAVSIRGPIDLSRFQVLAFDYAPEAAEGSQPVTITTHDQARPLGLILDEIGGPVVMAFVGCPCGGLCALTLRAASPALHAPPSRRATP